MSNARVLLSVDTDALEESRILVRAHAQARAARRLSAKMSVLHARAILDAPNASGTIAALREVWW